MFYAELQDWRETAAQCGLDTPEIGNLEALVYVPNIIVYFVCFLIS